MRWILGILAAAVVIGYVVPADAGCTGCNGGWSSNQSALSGEACCSPPGFAVEAWTPSACCVNPRPCCDNAWAGYCEHRAKVQAFWTRVGTPNPPCRPWWKWWTPAPPYPEKIERPDCR